MNHSFLQEIQKLLKRSCLLGEKHKISSKLRTLLSKAELGRNATSFPEWTSKGNVEVLPQGLFAVLPESKQALATTVAKLRTKEIKMIWSSTQSL